MTYRNFTRILLVGAALGLGACGGGGGGGVNSTPPPPVTPPPPPPPAGTLTIIEAATTSQEFAVKGATDTSIAPADQVRIRYVAATNKYEVQLPSTSTWLHLWFEQAHSFTTGGGSQWNFQRGIDDEYAYSALAEVQFADGKQGGVAFGMPTPNGGVPTSGSATFDGTIFGHTNETFNGFFSDADPGYITGDIDLSFNFGAGTLSGSISPILFVGPTHDLPTLQFTSTVYSTGSTTFSGSFGTSLTGSNSFSGLFTGPAGQELIGDFIFPYTSPVDSQKYQAAGAFVAKSH